MIKLSKPYIPDVSINKVSEILLSGELVQGKYVELFEKKLSDYLNVHSVILVSSGTAALHLSLMALEIKPGDEVIVPAYTFPATANVVVAIGAKPVFADIHLKDFCINYKQIESKITPKTRAIIPVHEFGQPADLNPIIKLAKKYNIHIIEDAACAIGSEYFNKKTGTFGILGCFSFHPRKIITTGEGGAVCTSDINLGEKIRSLRNHGIALVDNTKQFIRAGLNYRMTDFQAALGIEQLKELDKTIEYHKSVALLYNKLLTNNPAITTPTILPNRKCNFQTYQILFKTEKIRDQVWQHLKKNNVEANFGANALHLTEFYSKNYNNGTYTNASVAYKQGLALPIGLHVNKSDINFISGIIINTVNNEL